MTRQLITLSAALLLAACSTPSTGSPVPFGIGKLPVNVLAVTTADPETSTVLAKVYVRWTAQPGAKIYEVVRQFGSNTAKVVQATDQLSYTDTTLGVGQAATYTVRALDGTNNELNASDAHALTVQSQTVAKPTGLKPDNNAALSVGQNPTFTWSPVDTASFYYVTVTRGDTDATVFQALTNGTSIKFGDTSPLKFTNFGDIFPVGASGGIARGIVYHWSVQAFRGDGGSAPDDVKALDVSTSTSQAFSQG